MNKNIKLLALFTLTTCLNAFSMDNNPSGWNRFSTGIKNFAVRMRQVPRDLREGFDNYGRNRLEKDKKQQLARKTYEQNPIAINEYDLIIAYNDRLKERKRADVDKEKINKEKLDTQINEGTVENPLNLTPELLERNTKARKKWFANYPNNQNTKVKTIYKLTQKYRRRKSMLQKEYTQSIADVQKQLRQTGKYPYKFGSSFE